MAAPPVLPRQRTCSGDPPRLVRRRQVPWGRLACMPLHRPFAVETLAADGRGGWRPASLTCTFLDANHCPGAVMV